MSEDTINRNDPGVSEDGFTNGESVHFTYNEELHNSTKNRKKKKKKKSKSKDEENDEVENGSSNNTRPQLHHATLTNPEDDYPTSRVIKQAPNGDVIVESLDDPETVKTERTHISTSTTHRDDRLQHSHSLDYYRSLPHPNPANIWDNSTLEEQENLKQFWESLDEPLKIELVKIDKQSIMEIFKNETRNVANKEAQQQASSHNSHGHNSHGHNHNHSHNNSHSHNHNHGHPYGKSNCTYCGRRANVIEDELENIYDNHFDDIIDFIHEVRDINDLNALPGLLFGGFHILDEEHKLQKLKERQLRNQQHVEEEEVEHDVYEVEQEDDVEEEENEDENEDEDRVEVHKIVEIGTEEVDGEFNGLSAGEGIGGEALQKILDPKLYQALNNIAFDKLNEDISSNDKHIDFLEKVGSLREVVKQLHQADKFGLEQGINFLQNFGKFSNNSTITDGDEQKKPFNGPVEQWVKGLLDFADDLLKNDGKSFIEMMETLSDSRNEREDILKKEVWVDEDEAVVDGVLQENGGDYEEEEEEEDEEDEEDEDDNELDSDHVEILEEQLRHHNCEHDHIHDHDDLEEDEEEYENNSIDIEASDTESEISEEEKMQEIRRLFLIQVIKLFQERLKSAYKEKLSQDRTKMLIEELEAEENAKKERELKN